MLKQKKAPAVFFVTDLTQLPANEIKDELESVETEVAKLTDQKNMRFMRPPKGIFDGRLLLVASALDYKNVFWSIGYDDWDDQYQRGGRYTYQQVMDQLHPGAVIRLHAISRSNMLALGKIIDDARRQGYEFKRSIKWT